MPRKHTNNPKNSYGSTNDGNRPISQRAVFGGVRIEVKRGKEYEIRKTFDGQSLYKCPGCNSIIPQGQPSFTVIEKGHILGEQAAIDARRHWHEVCWRSYR